MKLSLSLLQRRQLPLALSLLFAGPALAQSEEPAPVDYLQCDQGLKRIGNPPPFGSEQYCQVRSKRRYGAACVGKKHGPYELYHEDGSLKEKGMFDCGREIMQYEIWNEQGTLTHRRVYADWGGLESEEDWSDAGVPVKAQLFDEQGGKIIKTFDSEGRVEESRGFHENGSARFIESWESGERKVWVGQTESPGVTVRADYEEGDLLSRTWMEASVETASQGVAKPLISILTPAVAESFSCNAPMARCAELLLLPENWGDGSEPLSLANFLDEPVRNYGLGMLAWGSLKEGSSHPLIRGPILLVLGGENNEDYGFFLTAGKRLKKACDKDYSSACEALAEYESVLGQSRIQVMLREGRYEEAMELIEEAAKAIAEVDPEWEERSMRQVYEAITDKVLRSAALHDAKILLETMDLIEDSAELLEAMDEDWPEKMHRQMQPDIELTLESRLYENDWEALVTLHAVFSPLREEGWGDNWKGRITFRAEQKINTCIDTLQWEEAKAIVSFFDGFQSEFWVNFWVENLDYLERMGGRQ